MDADIRDAPCARHVVWVFKGRGADQEAPSPSSAPLRGPAPSAPVRGPAPHQGDQQAIRCACSEIVRARLATLLRARVRAGYHHSSRADRWHEMPAVEVRGRVGWDRKTDLEALRQGHDRRFPKSGMLRRPRKKMSLQLRSSTFATGVRASTNQRQKRSHPCTPLLPGATGLVETALQDDRPAACVGIHDVSWFYSSRMAVEVFHCSVLSVGSSGRVQCDEACHSSS